MKKYHSQQHQINYKYGIDKFYSSLTNKIFKEREIDQDFHKEIKSLLENISKNEDFIK